jgi:stage II sporulation protein D
MLCAGVGAGAGAGAGAAEDGGGRDVSVALFSTRSLHAVTVVPLDANAWIARCAGCPRQPLRGPLEVAGVGEIFAGGTLRVVDKASGDARTATGLWHVRASGPDGELDRAIDVVLTIPSERYVAAVLNAEAAAGEGQESLRALAIVARTYALHGRHFAARPNHLAAELCDSTECQAMLPGPVSQAIEDATQATAGETLWFGGRRAEAYFSESCGGLTEDAGALWPGLGALPYLRSHADVYCARRDKAEWHAEVPLAEMEAIAKAEGWGVPARIERARVAERSGSHRALRVEFIGSDGARAVVSASALRFGIGRALGWNRVRSDAYEIGVRNGALVFDGRGYGHGVGLCQEGAAEMAAEGKSAREILAFYFPGTAVRILSGDEGWQETRVGGVSVRDTRPVTAERMAAVGRAWSEAQRRFPPRRAVAPEIVFAPTTEIFRQMTSQPGWELASTRGNRVVLQPEAVLRGQGRDAEGTMLHELLHVLVEEEAGAKAPLWLREGLVEALAGEAGAGETGAGAAAMSVGAIESALMRAGSRSESERAHLAAGARVRVLIHRYGLPAVRGWLGSGVPAGVG